MQKSIQKNLIGLIKLSVCAYFFSGLFFGSVAMAECSRADVDYYLSKGFTQAQVTALCGGASDDRQYQSRGERETEKQNSRIQIEQSREDIILVKTAIAAWDIELTPEKLAYTRKICVSVGQGMNIGGRTKACPDVRFEVFFKGLEVFPFRRKYFFIGQREIEVKGRVRRKLLNPFSEYAEVQRRTLIKAYKAQVRKGGTHIPVRVDGPLSRVEELLRNYIARAS